MLIFLLLVLIILCLALQLFPVHLSSGGKFSQVASTASVLSGRGASNILLSPLGTSPALSTLTSMAAGSQVRMLVLLRNVYSDPE